MCLAYTNAHVQLEWTNQISCNHLALIWILISLVDDIKALTIPHSHWFKPMPFYTQFSWLWMGKWKFWLECTEESWTDTKGASSVFTFLSRVESQCLKCQYHLRQSAKRQYLKLLALPPAGISSLNTQYSSTYNRFVCVDTFHVQCTVTSSQYLVILSVDTPISLNGLRRRVHSVAIWYVVGCYCDVTNAVLRINSATLTSLHIHIIWRFMQGGLWPQEQGI